MNTSDKYYDKRAREMVSNMPDISEEVGSKYMAALMESREMRDLNAPGSVSFCYWQQMVKALNRAATVG